MKLAALILIPIHLLLFMTSQLNAATCNEIITGQVVETYQLDTSMYRIEILSNQLGDRELTSDQVTFRPLSQKEPLGLFTILMTVNTPNGEEERTQVRMRVTKYADVLVATDRIPKGTALITSLFAVTRTDVTTAIEQPLTDTMQILGLVAARNLQRGQVVTTGAVEKAPSVIAGRPLTILFEHGACRITAPGVAMQSAAVGEYARVRNATSGTVMLARVIGENSVTVEP